MALLFVFILLHLLTTAARATEESLRGAAAATATTVACGQHTPVFLTSPFLTRESWLENIHLL